MPIYDISISADLGAMIPEVGELANQLSAGLAEVGYEKNIAIRSVVMTGTLTSDHELSQEEIEKMRNALLVECQKAMPSLKLLVESIRRQSGNVQQSAS